MSDLNQDKAREALIEEQHGNLLEAEAQALVNTVNCVGVMGKGIALQFDKKFPWNSRVYVECCKAGEMKPGRVLVVESPGKDAFDAGEPRFIINFPTKDNWRSPSRLEWIRNGLENLVEEVRARGIASLAIPPLGCGNGGLKWSEVRPLIEDAFASLPDVRVLLYPPEGAPAPQEMETHSQPPKMSVTNAFYVRLLENYATFEWSFSELELQKLAYFLQVAGQDLKLRFEKGRYGPYAPNLRHVLKKWEGHWMVGYGDGTGGARRAMTLRDDVSVQAEEVLQREATFEARRRLDDVARLTEGFESAFGVELLATVHWAATKEGARTVREAVEIVHQWNDYKRATFTERFIEIAWTRLRELEWIKGKEAEGNTIKRENPAQSEEFLARHPELDAVLKEAVAEIRAQFGGAPLHLRIVSGEEAVLAVQTRDEVSVALEKLDHFERTFWPGKGALPLTVTLDFVEESRS